MIFVKSINPVDYTIPVDLGIIIVGQFVLFFTSWNAFIKKFVKLHSQHLAE